jgi:hypothetical protein
MAILISEEWLRTAVFLLVRLAEAGAALVIFSGTVIGFVRSPARSSAAADPPPESDVDGNDASG